MRLREATHEDSARLVEFFQRTPMSAGTSFVLDRGPDFFALLALRGASRTFALFNGDRLVGTATALWRTVHDQGLDVVHGEVVDLRVADFARGTRAAWRLLGAVREAFTAAGVMWVSCLIAGGNQLATALVTGRAGLPPLSWRRRYQSAHYLACRPPWRSDDEWSIESAGESTDPSARSTTWTARDASGRQVGTLRLWDGDSVRRIRIEQYRRAEWPLRVFSRLAGAVSAGVALPREGGVLRTWASREFVVDPPNRTVVRALLSASVRAAVHSGRHVVQINLDARDPLVELLPRFPRSTFMSDVYGAPFGPALRGHALDFTGDDADIALT